MTIPQKPEAEALRIGMLAGLFTRADAVAWADNLIGELDKPCNELIDLSTSDGLDGSSFAALLSSIPGAADAALTKRILFGRARQKLSQGGDVSACLAQLGDLVAFSDEEKKGIKDDTAKFLAAYELKGETRLLG
ncbi:MAG TPA: hypothetical protein VGK67_31200 [Myxococcales bacterium]|jgi:hypothetical protein